MSVRKFLLQAAIAAFATACADGGDEPADTDTNVDTDVAYDGPPGTGKLALTFEMDEAYWEQWEEGVDTAKGPFWGVIWNADDVSAIGPDDGAEGLADLEVAEVDMTDAGGPTGVLITSEPITLAGLTDGWVTILGFVDSDGNADVASPDPDQRDPVTLPNENQFQVIEGQTTTVNVYFGLLAP